MFCPSYASPNLLIGLVIKIFTSKIFFSFVDDLTDIEAAIMLFSCCKKNVVTVSGKQAALQNCFLKQ